MFAPFVDDRALESLEQQSESFLTCKQPQQKKIVVANERDETSETTICFYEMSERTNWSLRRPLRERDNIIGFSLLN